MRSRTPLTAAAPARASLATLALASLLWTGAARAEEDVEDPDKPSGWEFGLRSGYALAFGKLAANTDPISDDVSGMIPIWVDAGYRITPHFYVGAYFQYGFILLADGCDGCSAKDIRLGANVHYHVLPHASVDPWLGAGLGYEWLSASQTTGSGLTARTLDATFHGFELLNLQAGVDFRISDKGTVGPFVAFTFDQASTQTVSSGNQSSSTSDFDKAFHHWLYLGVRVAFIP